MINFNTATPLQVKQEVDQIASRLAPNTRQFAEGIARKLADSPTPLNLAAIRAQASTMPGGLPQGQPAELVVIAIIAILIGLLLPAVQKVRESAARTTGAVDGVQAKYAVATATLAKLVG